MSNIQLTRNFTLDEFKCHDGTVVPSDFLKNVNSLAFQLQIIRDHVNSPIKILSGYRTRTWNEFVKGSPKSQHLLAKAADIACNRIIPLKMYHIIIDLISADMIKEGGVGLYNDFVHYDIRGAKARWDLRTHPDGIS